LSFIVSGCWNLEMACQKRGLQCDIKYEVLLLKTVPFVRRRLHRFMCRSCLFEVLSCFACRAAAGRAMSAAAAAVAREPLATELSACISVLCCYGLGACSIARGRGVVKRCFGADVRCCTRTGCRVLCANIKIKGRRMPRLCEIL
jgi:hypothetical protein